MSTFVSIDTATESLVNDVIEIIGDGAFRTIVSEIETEEYPGFIPPTDGGYSAAAHFGLHNETARATKPIAPFVEADEKACTAEYLVRTGLAEIDYDDEEWQEFASEWEQNEDGNTWFVYVRAIYYAAGHYRNDTGEDEVFFFLGVNDDFEYGRDHIEWAPGVGTKDVWSETVKVTDLTEEKFTELRAVLLQAWGDC